MNSEIDDADISEINDLFTNQQIILNENRVNEDKEVNNYSKQTVAMINSEDITDTDVKIPINNNVDINIDSDALHDVRVSNINHTESTKIIETDLENFPGKQPMQNLHNRLRKKKEKIANKLQINLSPDETTLPSATKLTLPLINNKQIDNNEHLDLDLAHMITPTNCSELNQSENRINSVSKVKENFLPKIKITRRERVKSLNSNNNINNLQKQQQISTDDLKLPTLIMSSNDIIPGSTAVPLLIPDESSPSNVKDASASRKHKIMPLYLRMIAKAQKKYQTEEKVKFEEYEKLKKLRSKRTTKEEIAEHIARHDEYVKNRIPHSIKIIDQPQPLDQQHSSLSHHKRRSKNLSEFEIVGNSELNKHNKIVKNGDLVVSSLLPPPHMPPPPHNHGKIPAVTNLTSDLDNILINSTGTSQSLNNKSKLKTSPIKLHHYDNTITAGSDNKSTSKHNQRKHNKPSPKKPSGTTLGMMSARPSSAALKLIPVLDAKALATYVSLDWLDRCLRDDHDKDIVTGVDQLLLHKNKE